MIKKQISLSNVAYLKKTDKLKIKTDFYTQ